MLAVKKEMMQEKASWFERMKSGLMKSSTKISEGLTGIFTTQKLEEEILEELEDLLIASDIGVQVAKEIIQRFSKEKFSETVTVAEIKTRLAGYIEDIINPFVMPVDVPAKIEADKKPFVVMVVGVNGNGKTTTVGKMAKLLQDAGWSVMISACDTFRAAAIEQLQVWAERVGCRFYAGKEGQDPASVAYQSMEQAKKEGIDILLIDTAGRLQSKTNLMMELQKISKVMKKINPSAPESIVLVLDATTGQNAHSQVETFKEMVGITGLVVTKLDGTAKGGVVVALADRFKIPVHAIGVGESVEDLREFNAHDFAEALVG